MELVRSCAFGVGVVIAVGFFQPACTTLAVCSDGAHCPNRCGNGAMEAPEECDDANREDGDGCSASCTVEKCGNGRVDHGEQCDDGNADDADSCLASCKNAVCGDKIVRTGLEECDDGNADDSDACVSACKTARCGDGFVHTGKEQCDDGNAANDDACVDACVAARCGDGHVRAGVEACDDGNAANDDACLATCVAAKCGDGFVQTGKEQCDDGNATVGDGCSAECTKEAPGCATAGTISCNTPVTGSTAGPNTIDGKACYPGGLANASEKIYQFVAQSSGVVYLNASSQPPVKEYVYAMVIPKSCSNTAACIAPSPTGTVTFTAVAGETYYVIIEGVGDYQATLTCG
jgi:cysteine-rich repeat protein